MKIFINKHITKITWPMIRIAVIIVLIVSVSVGFYACHVSMKQNTSLENIAADVFAKYQESGIYDPNDVISINGIKYRTDCSGYIDAVLNEADIIETTAASIGFLTDKDIRDSLTEYGFTYINLNTIENITSPTILVKEGNIAIIFPNNEYGEYTYYCWGNNAAIIKTFTTEQIDKFDFGWYKVPDPIKKV